MVTRRRSSALFMLVLSLSVWERLPVVLSRIRCYSIFDCEAKVRNGSECLYGYCTNPYHRGGCLPNRLRNYYKVRTCNSEDPPSAAEKGYCVPSALDYTEVRIASQNWESAFFNSWILQILLSELLGVPVTIETGTPEANVNFYDLNTSFDYGLSDLWSQFRVAKDVKDCRKVDKKGANYTACAHLIPEVWAGSQAILNDLINEQAIEAPTGLGALGSQPWFIRKSTAERYPEMVSFLGLQGPEARKKLARVFKRPTSWAEYCALISTNGCRTPDAYAQRAPLPEEEDSYFDPSFYTGYFRATTKNNCTNNPNCTGHMVDYPCGWDSNLAQQTVYNDIGLESNGKEVNNGYPYSQMTQIWAAADALDADVVMRWWHPQSLYQQFLGTKSEFTVVTLPPITQECLDNRLSQLDQCSPDPAVRLGSPLGACADDSQSLSKVMSTALREISFDPTKPSALNSPAYDAIKNFRISEYQLGEMLQRWLDIKNDKFNLDPRDAVCGWVIDNLELVQSYVPRGHPRVIVENDGVYHSPIFDLALALGCLALAASVVSTGITYYQRKKTVMRYAQIEFLFLVLIGLLLVSIAAIMTSLAPTNFLCIAIVWFVNFGYTVELVPLVVKVAAINRLMVASAHMRRVHLRKATLFGTVFLVCLLVGVTLSVWTVMDPPRKAGELKLTSDKTENGEIIIERTYYCFSNHEFWYYMGVIWQLLLLLCASVLAFQTRKIREDLNETKTLAMMIYSHFVFVSLRAITYLLNSSFNQSDLKAARSIIYSLDTMSTLCIYFVPKFLKKEVGNFKKPIGSSGSQTPEPLNVHTWKGGKPTQFRPAAAVSGLSDSGINSGSQGSQSIEYQTQAEITRDTRLDQISEGVGDEEDSAAGSFIMIRSVDYDLLPFQLERTSNE